jgi:hypothetical protein
MGSVVHRAEVMSIFSDWVLLLILIVWRKIEMARHNGVLETVRK